MHGFPMYVLLPDSIAFLLSIALPYNTFQKIYYTGGCFVLQDYRGVFPVETIHLAPLDLIGGWPYFWMVIGCRE